MRVVAMFRVSTEKQAEEGASLDAQERRFYELANANSWNVVATFRGCESATKAAKERQVLQQVLETVESERPDAIYVHEQSRLTRGDELEVARLLRELRERQVKIIVAGVVRDLASIDERFMVSVQGLIDRTEAERIRERVSRGKIERARQGKKNSGPCPFGYLNPPQGNPDRGVLTIIEDEAAVVRKIFRAAAAGKGTREIARMLDASGIKSPRGGRWGKTTVSRILNNPAYIGVHASRCWRAEPDSNTFRLDLENPDAIVVEGAHPSIISQALWQKVHRRPSTPTTRTPRMLTGFLTINGQPARGNAAGGTGFYHCPGVKGLPWLPSEETEDQVWGVFVKVATDPAALARLVEQSSEKDDPKEIGRKKAKTKTLITKLESRMSRLTEMRADGEITRREFAELRQRTEREIQAAHREVHELEGRLSAAEPLSLERAAQAIRRILKADRQISRELRRSVLQQVVHAVSIEAEHVGTRFRRDGRGRITGSEQRPWKIRQVSLDLAVDRPATAASSSCSLGTTSSCWGRRAPVRP